MGCTVSTSTISSLQDLRSCVRTRCLVDGKECLRIAACDAVLQLIVQILVQVARLKSKQTHAHKLKWLHDNKLIGEANNTAQTVEPHPLSLFTQLDGHTL